MLCGLCIIQSSDLLPLLSNPSDKRIPDTDFGTYTKDKFSIDLLEFNEGESLTEEQETLISQSYDTVLWLAKHGVTFDPIWKRQSFKKIISMYFGVGLH